MTIRAVVFDVGGVLERIAPPTWTDRWCARLGMPRPAFDAALARVDPHGESVTGRLAEAALQARYAELLGLSPAQAEELMADIWDWYCGELDVELVAYAGRLRRRLRTGILSNSADGARREEQRRHRLPELVDDVVYSHEVGLAKPDPAVFALACERLGVAPGEVVFVDDLAVNVDSAARAGLRAIRHVRTPETIARIEALTRPSTRRRR